MDELILLGLAALAMTVTAVVLSYLSLSGSKQDLKIVFIALMFFEVLIGWSYYLDTASSTIEEKLFWNNLEYAGYLGATVTFLLFALFFTGNKYAGKKVAMLLVVLAIIFQAIVVSNDLHGLFYGDVSLPEDVYTTFDAEYGPLFYAFASFDMLVIIIGNAVLIKHYISSTKAHRRGAGLVMVAGAISLLAVILNFSLLGHAPGGFIVMIGLIFASIPLFIGAFSFELFDMLPFAMDRVMDTMQDSVLVLDEKSRVMFMNRSAERLSGLISKDAYGLPIERVLARFPTNAFDVPDDIEEGRSSRPVFEVGDEHFEVEVSPILDQRNSLVGRMVLIRDITLRKVFEKDAKMTHEKLDLLNSITRHDIKNQLVILDGRINLARSKVSDPEVLRHLDEGLRAIGNIEKQTSFAKDYQELGKRAPTWQSLESIFRNIVQVQDMRGVKVSMDTDGVEVFADPLLTKVFYNLVNNSLSHGGELSNITVDAKETDGHLEIIYRDDGVGIPIDEKKAIFEKGRGRHSGYGLFLSNEILHIGGMEMIEDGEPGSGARFRITIPKGSYRFVG
ncbi:MAG: PAS domain-containing protein [Methanomassiliicoccales archaeon]|nr:MAG: PAS domain-containing protein [Methanomassiliicoccales archaeon]